MNNFNKSINYFGIVPGIALIVSTFLSSFVLDSSFDSGLAGCGFVIIVLSVLINEWMRMIYKKIDEINIKLTELSKTETTENRNV